MTRKERSPSDSDVVILGGGLAGLTCAREVCRRGLRAIVLEAEDQWGGLSRTCVRDGFRFDLGGHRFHTRWPDVQGHFEELLAGRLLMVERRSRIHINGRYIDYPLRFPNALSAFSRSQAFRVLVSYLSTALRPAGTDGSFEAWAERRFGPALFEMYFRPYTEKVLGLRCAELSADWAHQRIRVPNLVAAVRGCLLGPLGRPAAQVSRFRYPREGFGELTERTAAGARETGAADMRLGCEVRRVTRDVVRDVWTVSSERAGHTEHVTGRMVVSTIPVHTLAKALCPDDHEALTLPHRLVYRDLICVFLALEGPRLSADTWTYYPDPRTCFGRTHEPANWSPHLVPDSRTSLCVEIFCSAGDPTWVLSDGEIVDAVLKDMAHLGLAGRERVLASWVQRVRCAYPIYRVGYGEEMKRFRTWIAQWPGLHLLGRTGGFEYLNADAVIRQSLAKANELSGLGPRP